ASEELGAVARQFLDALRQRDVEPLTEIGDPRLRFLVAFLGRVERLFERGELTAQRADLLIQDLDLCQRARRYLLFGVQRLVEFAGATRGVVAGSRKAFVKALDAVALGFGRSQTCPHLRERVLQVDLAELLQRKQIVQLRDFGIELHERLALAADLLRQEELHHQEYRQQEHDREHERR